MHACGPLRACMPSSRRRLALAGHRVTARSLAPRGPRRMAVAVGNAVVARSLPAFAVALAPPVEQHERHARVRHLGAESSSAWEGAVLWRVGRVAAHGGRMYEWAWQYVRKVRARGNCGQHMMAGSKNVQ